MGSRNQDSKFRYTPQVYQDGDPIVLFVEFLKLLLARLDTACRPFRKTLRKRERTRNRARSRVALSLKPVRTHVLPTNLNPTGPGKTFRLVPSRVPGGTSDISHRPARVSVNAEEATRPLRRDLHRPPTTTRRPVVAVGQFTSLSIAGCQNLHPPSWTTADHSQGSIYITQSPRNV